jgi:serine/threonine protein kinase
MPNLVGKIIKERYRVEESLGRGGMAEVYKVWDKERATYLALKLLREDLARDVVFLRRFQREARNLAQLQHPHIVRFYGLEQDELKAFMLMDYVEGEDLKTEIFFHRGEGIPPQRTVEIIHPVCSALAYAHKCGYIHCDVKPGNVILADNGRVLIADFGIARLTDSATATMVGAGTPAYMAPEQVKGLDPVPQTDIYALGVVLFEMLTGGERPFTGERAETTGTMSDKVRWEQVNLDPVSPRTFTPDLSPELETVVLKCLEKVPVERYETPLDLLVALQRAVRSTRVEEVDSEKGDAVPETRAKSEPSDGKRSKLQPEAQGSEVPIQLEPVPASGADTSASPEPDDVKPSEDRPSTVARKGEWKRFGGWVGLGAVLLALMVAFLGRNIIMPPTPTSTDTLRSTDAPGSLETPSVDEDLPLAPASSDTLRSTDAPGLSETPSVDEALPPVIDVISFSYFIDGEEIVAEMVLRDLPKTMTFNQIQVPEGQDNLEYKWGLYIDMDGDRITGAPSQCSYTDAAVGTEYEMDAAYYSQSGEDPVDDKLQNRVGVLVGEYLSEPGDCWGSTFSQHTQFSIKPEKNKLVFKVKFPGVNQNTKVYYLTAARDANGRLVFDELD